jgi:peroxiredoxin Q/BCP
MVVEIGDSVPSFQGYDANGQLFSSASCSGTVTVIYFYLQDDTPMCTREACDFRDAANELHARGVIVIGVSPDSVEVHRQFVQKYGLNFRLLSDPSFTIAQAFGVVRPGGKLGPDLRSIESRELSRSRSERNFGELALERTTFIIDKKGTIRWIERSVDVEEHISRVMSEIDALEPT